MATDNREEVEIREFYRFDRKDFVMVQYDIGTCTEPNILNIFETNGSELKITDQLRYYKQPKLEDFPLDIKNRSETKLHWENHDYHLRLDVITHYLLQKRRDQTKCEIITHTGALNVVMHMIYLQNNKGLWFRQSSYSVICTRYRNKLYMIDGLSKMIAPDTRFWNHLKFQQYCSSDDPNKEPDTSVPVVKEKLFAVMERCLGNLNLLYSTPLRLIDSKEKIDGVEELRASKKHRRVHMRLVPMTSDGKYKHPQSLGNRIFEWWMDTYWSGFAGFYIGHKIPGDLVKYPLIYKSAEELAQQEGDWSPRMVLTFVHRFLTKVLAEMDGVDCPYTCYQFELDPKHPCVNLKIHEGKSEFSFLNEDFVEFLRHGSSTTA